MLQRCLLFVLMVSTLLSCTPKDENMEATTESSEPVPTSEPKQKYLSTKDLPGIKEYGKLRLIAPRFDGAEALPRSGIPVETYQNVAAQMADELGLDVQWIYVDGFADLIPGLNKGVGDVVITNMSITDERKQQVKFSQSIARVSEVLVAKKEIDISSWEALEKIKISIPEGTAYLETLKKKEEHSLNIELLPTEIGDVDLIEGILQGDYEATILDSDIVDALLPAHPELKRGLVINKRRKIAWAVRKENPELLKFLNNFLVSHHIKASSNKSELRDWAKIKERGRIRMLTTNNPASYFMYRGELMGFDYDLMKKFADKHDLHLSVIIKENIPDLFAALQEGEGDVIAASITASKEREDLGLIFSRPYLKVTEQLVGRSDGPKVDALEKLEGYSIGINPQTVFAKRLQQLQKENTFEIKEYENKPTEELIRLLENKVFDFTVADSHLVAIEHAYHKDILVNLDLTEEANISWVLRPDQATLKSELDAFIKKQYRGLFYNVTFNKYFKNSRKIKKFQDGRVLSGKGLSPYDNIVKPIAQRYGMDWRLVIAQMYQESKFNPKARSFAGAEGLMQVLPRTAKQFGFVKLKEPKVGIEAGMSYLNWLDDRFPQNLDVDQRIYFTLAAYNAGTGHVRDAMTLAKRLGYNPNLWFGNVEQAMLKLSEPQYYKNSRFGYVRGSEPVTYVKTIRDRYLGYLNAGVE